MPNPEETRAQERWTIKVCAKCGAIAGGQDSFGPWCVGSSRTHQAKRVEVIPASELERFAERVAGELDARADRLHSGTHGGDVDLDTQASYYHEEIRPRKEALREAASLIRNSAKGEGR